MLSLYVCVYYNVYGYCVEQNCLAFFLLCTALWWQIERCGGPFEVLLIVYICTIANHEIIFCWEIKIHFSRKTLAKNIFRLRNFRPRYLFYTVARFTPRLGRKLILRSEISSFFEVFKYFWRKNENFQKKEKFRCSEISERRQNFIVSVFPRSKRNDLQVFRKTFNVAEISKWISRNYSWIGLKFCWSQIFFFVIVLHIEIFLAPLLCGQYYNALVCLWLSEICSDRVAL